MCVVGSVAGSVCLGQVMPAKLNSQHSMPFLANCKLRTHVLKCLVAFYFYFCFDFV